MWLTVTKRIRLGLKNKRFKKTINSNNNNNKWGPHLITPVGGWNTILIQSIFLLRDAQAILQIPLPMQPLMDHLGWQFITNGAYSVKSAYRTLMMVRSQHPPSEISQI